jgi:hypothetical protein
MSPTHLPRALRDLLGRAEPSPTKPYALLVLVLFVIWLLAAGYDLASAVTAAVAVSWAAGGTFGGGALPPVAGVSPDPTPRPLWPVIPLSATDPQTDSQTGPLTVLVTEPANLPPDRLPSSSGSGRG